LFVEYVQFQLKRMTLRTALGCTSQTELSCGVVDHNFACFHSKSNIIMDPLGLVERGDC